MGVRATRTSDAVSIAITYDGKAYKEQCVNSIEASKVLAAGLFLMALDERTTICLNYC